tara:strand:+ start:2448 stop:2702 length:255 start_codon:yes stop_codon:yes gene_type:complete
MSYLDNMNKELAAPRVKRGPAKLAKMFLNKEKIGTITQDEANTLLKAYAGMYKNKQAFGKRKTPTGRIPSPSKRKKPISYRKKP